MKKGDHLFLVDGSGYIFRAYHALPPLNRKSDGLPTSAVLGFCNMVWKLMQDARNTDVGVTPTHFAVIFDYSSKTFRNELYAEYKANRSAPPEDLIPQFGLIRAGDAGLRPALHRDGGFRGRRPDRHLCAARLRGRRRHHHHLLRQGSDAARRRRPCRMYDPMKDRQIGIPEVIEKWGVPPEKMIDLQALTGDSVDNVPGVPGIGPKTAAQLLEQFGDLDTLLARAGEIKQDKRRQTIIDNADKARISRELVRLKNDVPVADGLDDLVLQPPNGPKLIAFLKAMEFSTLTRRVAEATGTDAGARSRRPRWASNGADAHGPDVGAGGVSSGEGEPAARRPEGVCRQPPGRAAAASAASASEPAPTPVHAGRRAGDGGRIGARSTAPPMPASAICRRSRNGWREARRDRCGSLPHGNDLARSDAGRDCRLRPCLRRRPGGLCAGRAPRRARRICSAAVSRRDQIPLDDAIEALRPLLADRSVLKIGHNVKYDWLVAHRHGLTLEPFDDTMLISYVLDGGTAGRTTSPRCRRNGSAISRSRSRNSSAPARSWSPSISSRSSGRPPTPPRAPISPTGCGRC